MSDKSDIEKYLKAITLGEIAKQEKNYVHAAGMFRIAHDWATAMNRHAVEELNDCVFEISREMDKLKSTIAPSPAGGEKP